MRHKSSIYRGSYYYDWLLKIAVGYTVLYNHSANHNEILCNTKSFQDVTWIYVLFLEMVASHSFSAYMQHTPKPTIENCMISVMHCIVKADIIEIT